MTDYKPYNIVETGMDFLLPTIIDKDINLISTVDVVPPYLRYFYMPGCNGCSIMDTKLRKMRSVFKQLQIGIDIVGIDGSDRNSGNVILAEAFKVIGYPTLLYTPANQRGPTVLEFNPGGEDFIEKFATLVDSAEHNEELNRKMEKAVKLFYNVD